MTITITNDWRKAEASNPNGACVECANFRVSTRSAANGNCTEVGTCVHGVAVRDSKLTRLGEVSPVLYFAPEVFAVFAAKVKAGTVL